MARLTAILLLACAACLLSWTAAAGATKAPAKGMAIDDVIVTDLAPTTAISQRIKVSEIKFYTGVVQGSGKPCLVVKGMLTMLDSLDAKLGGRIKVVVTVTRLGSLVQIASEMEATADFVPKGTGSAHFVGVGKGVGGSRCSYNISFFPPDVPRNGDFKQPETRESGLKE